MLSLVSVSCDFNLFTDYGNLDIFQENAGLDNSVHDNTNNKPNEDCEHSLILRDDIGYVCRVCGKVEMEIQKIFEFQYKVMIFLYIRI